MAKFGIFGKILDKICIFWRTKNGSFSGKIVWSLVMYDAMKKKIYTTRTSQLHVTAVKSNAFFYFPTLS